MEERNKDFNINKEKVIEIRNLIHEDILTIRAYQESKAKRTVRFRVLAVIVFIILVVIVAQFYSSEFFNDIYSRYGKYLPFIGAIFALGFGGNESKKRKQYLAGLNVFELRLKEISRIKWSSAKEEMEQLYELQQNLEYYLNVSV